MLLSCCSCCWRRSALTGFWGLSPAQSTCELRTWLRLAVWLQAWVNGVGWGSMRTFHPRPNRQTSDQRKRDKSGAERAPNCHDWRALERPISQRTWLALARTLLQSWAPLRMTRPLFNIGTPLHPRTREVPHGHIDHAVGPLKGREFTP